MSEFSLRGRRKKGRVGGGRRKALKLGKGKGGYLSLSPQSPSLFLFLSIPYPLSTPATQARVNYAAILAGKTKKLNK